MNKLILCFLFITSFSSAQKSPNVVFILADDLGYHDLGYSGSKYYETPNIDALAGRSMNFVNGYAASRGLQPFKGSNYDRYISSKATNNRLDWCQNSGRMAIRRKA